VKVASAVRAAAAHAWTSAGGAATIAAGTRSPVPEIACCGTLEVGGRRVSWRSARIHSSAAATARSAAASGRDERAAAVANAATSAGVRSNQNAAAWSGAVATAPESAMRSPSVSRYATSSGSERSGSRSQS